MPSLTVHLGAPLAPPERRDLARALTDLTVRELGKRGELTAVRLIDVDPADWFVGGEPAGPTAWLAIDITAGTNDAAQKERFIAQAHDAAHDPASKIPVPDFIRKSAIRVDAAPDAAQPIRLWTGAGELIRRDRLAQALRPDICHRVIGLAPQPRRQASEHVAVTWF